MILKIKEFFKKRILLFPILPVLVIELVVLNKSLKNFFWQSLSSPSKLISLKNQSTPVNQAVLGAKTDFLSSLAIEKMLIGVIVFLVIIIGIMIFRGGNKRLEDGKGF